jgi:calcineurin-like phosphoesterase family protein
MNGENVWFTSDTHFGHKSIIQYCNRPWGFVHQMDEGLIQAWNDRVKPSDDVFHLGDFSFHNAQYTIDNILPRLSGRLHLIEGNHDKIMRKHPDQFTSMAKLKNVKVDGKMLVLCHFPLLSWEGRHKGWWHLHGHCHGNLPDDPGAARLDVGVDANNYAPVSFWSIQRRLEARVDKPVDHHGGK